MPRILARLLLVVLALSFWGSAHAQKTRQSRMRVSHSGLYGIRMEQTGEACRLEVLKDSQPHWELRQCVGSPDDLYFISEDGEKFWVIYTVPQKGTKAPKVVRRKGKKAPKRYPAWTYTNVAVQYDKSGNVLVAKQLNDFIKTGMGLQNVRQLTKHFKWLEGVVGVPGNPPRLNKEGQVELNTLEPKIFRLDF